MFKKLGKSILIYGIASSIGKFVALFFVPIYTRIFSPEDYGIIDIISVTISFISILGILQLESAISRYYYTYKDEKVRNERISTAYWTVILVSSILAIILIVFSGIISNLLFDSSKYAIIISIAVFTLPLSNILAIYTVLIRFLQKPVHYTFIVLTQLLITVFISILLVVYLDKGIIGVFLGQLSGLVAGVLFSTIYLRNKISFIWNWGYLKEMFRYSLPMVPSVAGVWINNNAGRFVILHYLTLTDIGLYTVALKIASVFSLIESAFVMAWGPFMWEMFEKPDHRQIYKLVMKIVTVGVFLIVSVVAIFGKEVLLLLTTPDYLNAAPLIGLIGFSLGLKIVGQTIRLGAGICKRTEYNTLIMFIVIGVNLLLLFVFVPIIGLIGAPISLLISSTLLIVLGWYISERFYYIGFSKLYFGIAYVITLSVVLLNTIIQFNLFYKALISIISLILFTTMLFTGKSQVLKFSSLSFFKRK